MNVVKCPKCGMTQMQRETCRGCGKPLAPPAPLPRRPAAAARPPSAVRPVATGVVPSPRPAPPVPSVAPAPLNRLDRTARSTATEIDPAFDRDIFLLKQPILAVNEKYEVWDESGTPIMFIERPAHLGRNLLAAFAGLTSGAAVLVLTFVLVAALGESSLAPFVVLIGLLVAALVGVLVGIRLSRKRHITFYRDASKAETLLAIRQDKKFTAFIQTFTIEDAQGGVLALVRKNWLGDILRKKWRIASPAGLPLFEAREDLLHAILTRVVAKLFPMNFMFYAEGLTEPLGSFNRKLTIRDRYVLDLSPDRGRVIDRRLGLALGVLLDTGERR